MDPFCSSWPVPSRKAGGSPAPIETRADFFGAGGRNARITPAWIVNNFALIPINPHDVELLQPFVVAPRSLGKIHALAHLPSGHLKARPRAFKDRRQPHSRQRLPRRRLQPLQISSRRRYCSLVTVLKPSATKSAKARARFHACRARDGGFCVISFFDSLYAVCANVSGSPFRQNKKEPAAGSVLQRRALRIPVFQALLVPAYR